MSMMRKTAKTTDQPSGPDPDTPLYPHGPTPAQLTEEGSVWRVRDPELVGDYVALAADPDLHYRARRRAEDPDVLGNNHANTLRLARTVAGLPVEHWQVRGGQDPNELNRWPWPAGPDQLTYGIHLDITRRAYAQLTARRQRASSDYWDRVNHMCSTPGCGSMNAHELHLVADLPGRVVRLCPACEAVANAALVDALRAQQLPDGVSRVEAVRAWIDAGMSHLDLGPAPAVPFDLTTLQGNVQAQMAAQKAATR